MGKKEEIKKISYDGFVSYACIHASMEQENPIIYSIYPKETELIIKHLTNCLQKYPLDDIFVTKEELDKETREYPENTKEEIKFYIRFGKILKEIADVAAKYANDNHCHQFNLDIFLIGLAVLTKHGIPYDEVNNVLTGILIGRKILINNENIIREASNYASVDVYNINSRTN